jgi:hypothetical protein
MLVTIPFQFKFATLGQQKSVEIHETSDPHCDKHEISFFLDVATCFFSEMCAIKMAAEYSFETTRSCDQVIRNQIP